MSALLPANVLGQALQNTSTRTRLRRLFAVINHLPDSPYSPLDTRLMNLLLHILISIKLFLDRAILLTVAEQREGIIFVHREIQQLLFLKQGVYSVILPAPLSQNCTLGFAILNRHYGLLRQDTTNPPRPHLAGLLFDCLESEFLCILEDIFDRASTTLPQ